MTTPSLYHHKHEIPFSTFAVACCLARPARSSRIGSHKRRDNRCHIAAPLLRSALHTCLSAHSISIDETGSSLSHLTEPPLETLSGSEAERQAEVAHRISSIESIEGGDGGEVGVFNINHLGGHRYAGVMLVSGPRHSIGKNTDKVGFRSSSRVERILAMGD